MTDEATTAQDRERLSDDDVVDELPEDLDASAALMITFPNNSRRRIPAVLYLLMGAAAIAVSVAWSGSAAVNAGLATAGAMLCAFALYGLVAGTTMHVDEGEALVAAAGKVGFAVGHASAQMSWRGVLSRPVWRLLIYSNEDPPEQRAIAIVDGVSGDVVEWFAEDNPEDWSTLSG